MEKYDKYDKEQTKGLLYYIFYINFHFSSLSKFKQFVYFNNTLNNAAKLSQLTLDSGPKWKIHCLIYSLSSAVQKLFIN